MSKLDIDKLNDPLIKKFIALNSQTESPELFLVWGLLSLASACAGRTIKFKLGDTIIYPNQMVLLVGNSGVRKSTVISTLQPLIPKYVAIAPNEIEAGSMGLINYMAGITERAVNKLNKKQAKSIGVNEDLLFFDDEDLSNIQSCQPSTRESNFATPLILNSEFATFIGHGAFKLLTTLSHLWDGSDYNRQGIVIKKPLINILSAITPSTLNKILPQEQAEQGFVSRCIFVYGEKTKQVPRPRFFSPDKMPELVTAYQQIEHIYNEDDTFDETDEAADYLDNLYSLNRNVKDFRFTYYNSRRHIHLIKLASSIAILQNTKTITKEIYQDADLILTATESLMPDALGEYGLSKLSEGKQKLLDYIKQAETPLTHKELTLLALKDMRDSDISSVLQGFINEGKIKVWINNGVRYYITNKTNAIKQTITIDEGV